MSGDSSSQHLVFLVLVRLRAPADRPRHRHEAAVVMAVVSMPTAESQVCLRRICNVGSQHCPHTSTAGDGGVVGRAAEEARCGAPGEILNVSVCPMNWSR